MAPGFFTWLLELEFKASGSRGKHITDGAISSAYLERKKLMGGSINHPLNSSSFNQHDLCGSFFVPKTSAPLFKEVMSQRN